MCLLRRYPLVEKKAPAIVFILIVQESEPRTARTAARAPGVAVAIVELRMARMQLLQQQVSERCQQVERSARDDVRRQGEWPPHGAVGGPTDAARALSLRV